MSVSPDNAVPLLAVEDVDVAYPRRGQAPVRAVIGASITVAAGEIVGLVGESGCGKSTLGRAAVGLVAATAGQVRYRGEVVEAMGRATRPPRLRSLQMVFQDPYASLNPRRRIGRQLADAIRLGTGAKLDDAEAGVRVTALLERVGLSANIAHRYPHEFSGGQCQRIAIARVLATDPACVVADEPISSLDASAQAQIANLLAGIVAGSGLGMLFISHDLSVVRKIAHRTVVMYLGRIVESGATEPIWHEPAHPYTRALIAAVPVPGAGRAWRPSSPATCRTRRGRRRAAASTRGAPTLSTAAGARTPRPSKSSPAGSRAACSPNPAEAGPKGASKASAAEEVLADGRQHAGAEKFDTAVVGQPVGRTELEPVGTRFEDGDGVLGNDVGVSCEGEPVEDLVRDDFGRRLFPAFTERPAEICQHFSGDFDRGVEPADDIEVEGHLAARAARANRASSSTTVTAPTTMPTGLLACCGQPLTGSPFPHQWHHVRVS